MDLFSQYIKDSASGAMTDVFDSFKRTQKLRVYKTPSEVYVSNADYNLDFEKGIHSSFLTQTANYEEFDARIIFLDNQPSEKFIGGGGELNIKTWQNYGRIKIQVRIDGYESLKNCKNVTFQGEKFIQEGDVRKVGILGNVQFYSFIYSKVT